MWIPKGELTFDHSKVQAANSNWTPQSMMTERLPEHLGQVKDKLLSSNCQNFSSMKSAYVESITFSFSSILTGVIINGDVWISASRFIPWLRSVVRGFTWQHGMNAIGKLCFLCEMMAYISQMDWNFSDCFFRDTNFTSTKPSTRIPLQQIYDIYRANPLYGV